MDNHRAALWCWFQHIPKDGKSNIIHIDRHPDTRYSRIGEWQKHMPDLWEIDINGYLNTSYETDYDVVPVFAWDNYLSLFLETYGHLVDTLLYATHDDGDPPRFDNAMKLDIWDLPGNFGYWLSEGQSKWIVNVDMDYFFCEQDECPKQMVSDSYVESLFRAISEKIRDRTVSVLTLCLSPECCGGWEASERLCEKACAVLGLDFKLPTENRDHSD